MIWEEGVTPDHLWGPFATETQAREIMTKRLAMHKFSRVEADGHVVTLTFHPHILDNGESVMVEVTTIEGQVMWTNIHEYDDKDHGWLSHLTEKGSWLESRGQVRT